MSPPCWSRSRPSPTIVCRKRTITETKKRTCGCSDPARLPGLRLTPVQWSWKKNAGFISGGSISHTPSSSVEEVARPDDIIYYDEFGNEISEEEALREELTLSNGTVVCTYLNRNQSVCSIRYTRTDDSLLPITVCTYDDLREARAKVNVRNAVFAGVYCAELAATFILYFALKNREKKEQT